MVIGKYMYERLLTDSDPNFLQYAGETTLEPAAVFSANIPNTTIDSNRAGWYFWPFLNGSSPFYTTTP